MKDGRFLSGVTASALMVCGLANGGASVVVVDSFDQAVQNEVRGYRSAFQRAPSQAMILRVDDVARTRTPDCSSRWGCVRHCMRVRATKRETGFCGLWIHLFDIRADSPCYFDASGFSHLSFWVKGKRGGEDFDIRLADDKWVARQDSVAIGNIGHFLAGGVTTHWQEVVVPLSGVGKRLNLSRLAGLTISFPSPGKFTLYLDNVSLKSSADSPVPDARANIGSFVELPEQPKAMWLWETADLLKEPARWNNLFGLCKQHRIGQIWIQLPYTITSPGTSESDKVVHPVARSPECELQQPKELRRFLYLAHQQGLTIHALGGAPEYGLREQHRVPLAVVDAVIAFNERGDDEERFDGIHFDNEPYLLVAWHSPKLREKILCEFLELNAECQRRVRRNSNMQYGIDVPFWWHAKAAGGEPHGNVSFRGVRKPASYHCIDMLDNVGVMNYRDAADGADGMLAHGRDLLAYADRVGGAAIFMGVETFAYADRTVWFCVGLPRDRFEETALQNTPDSLRSRIAGFRIRLLDDGTFVHLGIEVPRSMTPRHTSDATRALRELSTIFGVVKKSELGYQAGRAKRRAEKAVELHPEWRGFRVCDIPSEGAGETIPGFRAESVMLSKVTFADNSCRDFQEQTEAASRYFRRFQRFRGLAIHSYESYRELVETVPVFEPPSP